MKRNHNILSKKGCLALALSGAMALSMLAACGSTETGTVPTGAAATSAVVTTESTFGSTQTAAAVTVVTATEAAAVSVRTDGATAISLNGDSASVSGTGAAFSDGVVYISAGGVYTLSGTLNDGRVVVEAKGEDVTLILDGADIHCSWGSPIYVYKAENVILHLADGSENSLSDGSSYSFSDVWSSAADEEPNACLYSKADLTIQGGGSLTVEANYNNGITSKDTLTIVGAAISVTAVNHGVNGKDSLDISDASISVTSGGDALRSSNDTDGTLGWVRITDSALSLTAGEDGVQAETVLEITGGSYTVTTGGGSGARLSSDQSAKGLKAGTDLALNSGTYSLNCADDGIHSNGNLTINGGTYTVRSGDDAIHAELLLEINGGSFDIVAAEGIEGTYVRINDGVIGIQASDDGINAAQSSKAYTATVEINGGDITIVMGAGDTDGIDSNGNIIVNGGTINVTGSSTFDCDGTATYNGGTIIVNGQQVDGIPNQMMGGMGGMGGQGAFGGQNGQAPGNGGFGGRGGMGMPGGRR